MTLLLEVALAPLLAEQVAPARAETGLMTAAAVRQHVLAVAEALGIPAAVEVRIVPDRPSGPDLVAIRAGGRPCRFPRRLPSRAAAALRGAWPATDDLAEPDGWLTDASPEEICDVVGTVCAQAVAETPSVLLTDEAVGAYADILAAASSERLSLDPAELARLLSDVIDLHIGIGDEERVAELLGETEDLDDAAQRTELLIAALASDTVGVLVPESLAAEMGSADDPEGLLSLVAKGLFEETGLVTPRLVAEPADGLPAGTFAVRINDLITLPCPLLPPDTCLVNDSPARLGVAGHGTGTAPATIPGIEIPGALAPSASKETLEDFGLTTWTDSGLVCLQLAVELRQRMASLVSQDRLFAQLDVLETMQPQLVPAARTQVPPAAMTRLVRKLAGDHVPLPHLPALLERLVDLPADDLGWKRYAVLDDPVLSSPPAPEAPPDFDQTEQFVRTGLRYHIADRVSRGGALVVYLLDPALDAELSAAELADETEERVVAAVRAELGHLPAAARTPALLVSGHARARLRTVVRPVFPTVTVLAHADLPPEAVVQPIARISAD